MKSPGRYRTDKVWIGPNSDITNARYIPPDANNVPDAMARWECYVNDDDVIPLIKAAVAHAEFESIHPFADGNGRIGRIAIPLMLEMDEVISGPCFYLSEFFEHKNTEYQDRLLAVSESNEWTEWCIFFLDAVATQAKENNRKANGVYELYKRVTEYLANTVRSDNAVKIAPHLFSMPIFPTTIFTNYAGLTPTTAKRVINALKQEQIVIEIEPHRGSKPAVLAFPELLEIVENVSLLVGQ
jgi:Fic family protein